MNEEAKKTYIKEYRLNNKDKIRQRNNTYMKSYYKENKDKVLAYQKEYYEKNKEKIKERVAKYKRNNKEHVDEYNKKYRQEHKKEHNDYIKERRKDGIYKMICDIRNMINTAINKRCKIKKRQCVEQILGCTIEEFIKYLQSKFQEGMTIENHRTMAYRSHNTYI